MKCYKTPAPDDKEQAADYQQFIAKVTTDNEILHRHKEVKNTTKQQYNVLVISAEGLADDKFPPLFADNILKGYNSLGPDLASSFIPLLTGNI